MIRSRYYILLIVVMLLVSNEGKSQDIGDYSKQEVKEFSQKVEDQIQFLEYFLNTLGSEKTPARDKDVVITESYKKIFRDGKVQVEDDLLLDRKVITNKDVQAYLKDVEFFFKDASFKFKVREVKPFLRDNGELSFSVSLDRTLSAVGLDGEKIEDTKPRYVEVNLDRNSNELKIASIYTTKLSRDKELQEWWGTLSLEWETYFREKFDITEDSVTMDKLNRVSAMDSLDLSGNNLIRDLYPIEALRDLKYVDISSTQITELNPISNVTFLAYLDVSNTPTEDIQFVKYSENLKYLDISGTEIGNIDELTNLKSLEVLKAANTPLMSFSVLNSFDNLKELDMESNGFNNLENINRLTHLKVLSVKGNYLINFNFLSDLENLEYLDLTATNVLDLTPLSKLEKLRVVHIDQTEVSSLNALDGMDTLEKVYADRTNISEELADGYARKNRNVLLIHNVENLQTWWNTLPDGWEDALRQSNKSLNRPTPTVEEISTIVSMDSLDISGSEVINLRPILKFKKIISLNFDETKIHDLAPLGDVQTLTNLSGNASAVTNVEALRNLNSLEQVSLEATNITSIAPLKSLENLVFLNVDQTEVPQWEIQELLHVVPEANIVFRSKDLSSWWESLDGVWKEVFRKQYSLGENPGSRSLHSMTSSRELKIDDASIYDLEPLGNFINLQHLEIEDVPLSDLSAISQLEFLKSLKINKAPVEVIEPLKGAKYLEKLDLSNTGVEDLRPLENLNRLRSLNLSGTGVKRLKGLEHMFELQDLNIASTNVRSLNPISDLINLKSLICFNTRINKRQISNFKSANPDCDIRYY